MRKLLFLSLLLGSHAANAQTSPPITVRATAVRDTLFQQAAAVRNDVAVRLARFSTSSLSLTGLRTKTRGYASRTDGRPYRVKRHVIKRKRTTWLVEKISYYNSKGNLLLREKYQNGQLTTLRLRTYYTPLSSSPGRVFTFTQGDYLRRSTYPSRVNITARGPATHEYFYVPAAPVAR
ncbi:hypothetical protein [Hymenobacter weizhouensis]|uniref:hypothetical protein n=1 Tax=Hymenobacter sp. YIM 151500-1 TaxID=2987689 RepID=UPI002226E7DE|nr:hypothetical protein [Hymenobacter sp. YIM 151500-1]UYZ62212.1 hypothetical protein OIS53_14560 [Hymenobacter sp. YIM 151500-1]